MIVRIVAGKVQGNFADDFQHFFVLLVLQFERHRVLTDDCLTYGNALDAAGPLGPESTVLKMGDPHRLVEERQRLRADMTVEQELCLYRNLKKESVSYLIASHVRWIPLAHLRRLGHLRGRVFDDGLGGDVEHDPPARARDVSALGPVVGRHVGVLPTDGRDSTGLLELEGMEGGSVTVFVTYP